ncbi:MAG: AAA family ATPase [Methylococcaceae bacterium]|nr:AAA family ATPase [Methylococcaceae bacterium]
MKKLPIGIQTFSELIEDNHYYVDKTPLISHLVENGKYYFLSRPRRFGKSLLVSTLKSAFRAEQALFSNLYLNEHWDWSIEYPVIHIDFGRGVFESAEVLNDRFEMLLNEIATYYQVELHQAEIGNRFAELIRALHEKTGQRVVILIDEYDKPILDNIDNLEQGLIIRESLKNIYSMIKGSDAYIKFSLLTGVSKFSKVSLFSGLNNLIDISLNSHYSTICGYTENEIKTVFTERLEGVDFKQLAQWYNGYNFLGEKVYNPFAILLYLRDKQFKNYWFETGSPSFLLKLVKERQYRVPDIENLFLTESDLGNFDINDITLETLLFQTGYLTIERVEEFEGESIFYLNYPNREVKMSLNRHLLRDLTHSTPTSITRHYVQIYKALDQQNFSALEQGFKALFAAIPNDWYRKNNIANYEGYYASIVYCCLCTLGFTVIAEDTTSQGRIDLTVIRNQNIFIFEFKVLTETDKQGSALAQIKTNNYAHKYISDENKVFLVGMEFDKQLRNLSLFEWEAV